MKVRVQYTEDCDDYFRRAVATYNGHHGELASRYELVTLFRQCGETLNDDIVAEYEQHLLRENEES